MKDIPLTLKFSILAALACLLAACLVDDAAAQNVSFIAGRHFVSQDSGGSRAPIVQRDFNRDGFSDLAVSGGTVLLGNGNGTFQTVRGFDPLIAVRNIDFLAAGDFNRDGIPDLAAVTSLGAFILIGNGNGTFQSPASVLSLGETQSDIAIAIGDFNRDGVEDLAIPHQSQNLLLPSIMDILLGNGDGTFKPVKSITGNPGGRTFAAISDFNGDGSQDLAWCNSASQDTVILLGNGDGSFQPVSQKLGAGLGRPLFVAAGDLNGDGVPDLAVTNDVSHDVQIWLGIGDGSFGPGRSFATGEGSNSEIIGDLNGDGIQDLLVTNGVSNDLSILLGNGDGTFQSARNLSAASTPNGNTPLSAAIGDFNGNGIQDLAVEKKADGSMAIFAGNGDGTFRVHINAAAGPQPVTNAVGDFNNDGVQDLAMTDIITPPGTVGRVSVLLGKGDGNFLPPIILEARRFPWKVAVGNLNGDGFQDLVVSNGGSGPAEGEAPILSIFFGNGDGTFRPAQDVGPMGIGHTVVIGDLNRDGYQDLAAVRQGPSPSDTVSIFLGNGSGVFQHTQDLLTGRATVERSFAIGDFEHDGIPDLAVSNEFSATVSLFRGNGDGTFQAARNIDIRGRPTSVAVADFNGDGFQDLALSNGDPRVPIASILMGNGDGSFQAVQEFGSGNASADSIVVGDFNADARQDLAAANQFSGVIAVLLGKGDGTFPDTEAFAAGATTSFLAIGDFNNDGAPDIAVPSVGTDSVSILLNDTDFQKLKNVNAFVNFQPNPATFRTTIDPAACPDSVGTFRFEAILTNGSGSPTLSNLFVQITSLTNGNLLQDSAGGLRSAGATLPIPLQTGFTDGVLSPQEVVTVPFLICLKNTEPFNFLVNVLGTNTDSAESALSGR